MCSRQLRSTWSVSGLVMALLLAFLLLPATVGTLFSQDGTVVVLTRNTGLSNQFLVTDSDIPWDVAKEGYSRHYMMITLEGCPAGWVAVMAQGAARLSEIVESATDLKDLFRLFRAAQKHNMVLQELDFFNDQWLVTLTMRAQYRTQTLLPSGDLPLEKIEKAAQAGWYVTSLRYGQDHWIAVISANTGFTGQRILQSATFPMAEIDSLLRDGFRVGEIEYGPDGYVVVMTLGTGWGDQIVIGPSSAIPSAEIEGGWHKGYHITSLHCGPELARDIRLSNVDVEEHLGDVAHESDDTWFDEFIHNNAGTEIGFVAVQRLAGRSIRKQQWQAAIAVYDRYRGIFPEMKERFEAIIHLLNATGKEGHRIENLGPTVNTEAGEFMPLPSADDSRLFFTGMRREGGIGGEDVFVSQRQPDGTWGEAEPVVGHVNTENHEFGTAIGTDNNMLVLFSAREGGAGRGDLYYSERERGGWGSPERFPEPINTIHWDCDGYLTSDGKALIFASDRPGAIGRYHMKDIPYRGERWGNTDIYVSLKTDTGWSTPINFGSSINTAWSERSPFLHPDGKTLYFSSSGRAGFGELDVFVSTRLKEDSWTEWSEPINLGKLINGPGSDWGYRVSTSGQTAYFAAEEASGGHGKSDIYMITTDEETRPDQVVTIRGVIHDSEGNPIQATVKWEDLSTGEIVGELKSDPETGEYFVVLPLGKHYGYFAEKSGFHPVSGSVDLQEVKVSEELHDNISLVQVEKIAEGGIAVRINNIFFDYDKSTLRPESRAELDRVVALFRQYPDALIEIGGHTDSIASVTYNQSLSERRAQAVVDYLIAAGYPKVNLVAKGYGELNPVADNGTDEGRQLNRRVEFRFLKSGERLKDKGLH